MLQKVLLFGVVEVVTLFRTQQVSPEIQWVPVESVYLPLYSPAEMENIYPR